MASKRISKPPMGQISLLDRLSDSPVGGIAESTLQRGEHPEQDIETGIRRDLEWLLNSCAYSLTTNLSPWKYVESSILNYGVHITAGRLLTNSDAPQIEKAVRVAIRRFEPRIRPETLDVKVFAQEINPHRLSITIAIDGDYMGASEWKPMSIRFCMDSETGTIQST